MRPHGSILAKLRLRQLALIVETAEAGSLHLGAQRSNVSQPAGTKMLREAEGLFGGVLFERTPRGMRLTHLGNAVVVYAKTVIADLSRLRDEVDALSAGASGKVVIGSILAPLSTLLSQAVASISESHPGITVAVIVDESERLIHLLLDGQLDFVIGRSQGAPAREVKFECLSEVDLVIVAGPNHPLRNKKNIHASTLAVQQWILPPRKNALRMATEEAFRQVALQPPAPKVETISNTLTVSLLKATPALAVMSESVAAVYGQRLVRVLRTDFSIHLGPYGLLTRAGRQPSPAAALLMERLKLHS